MRGARWDAFDVDKGCCGAFERLTERTLVLYIFTFLDLQHIFKLRAVCKSWYDAVLSPPFIHLFSNKIPLDPWAVFRVRTQEPPDRYEDIGSYEYNPDLHYGEFDYEMKLQAHAELWRPGMENEIRKKTGLPLGPPGSQFVALCGSNGLVCGRLMEHKRTLTLAVGNPITNKWKTLPYPHIPSHVQHPRPAYLSIFMEATDAHYQIVVFYWSSIPNEEGLILIEEEDVHKVDVQQYDSKSGEWESGPAFDPESSCGSPLRGYAFHVSVDDVLGAYDPCTKAWSHVVIPRPVCADYGMENWSVSFVGVFMHTGKHFLATVLDKAEELQELGLAIWEMDQKYSKWRLVSRVLSKELYGPNWGLSLGNRDMKVQLVGDIVFISTFYRKEAFGEWPPVAYDMARAKWYSCVSNTEFHRNETTLQSCLNYDIECNYVIVPNLAAVP